jgi:hypothetical protein
VYVVFILFSLDEFDEEGYFSTFDEDTFHDAVGSGNEDVESAQSEDAGGLNALEGTIIVD